MGVKPAQAELNTALKPIFCYITNVYLIHDDLLIATKSIEEHLEVIHESHGSYQILPLTQTNVLLAQRK